MAINLKQVLDGNSGQQELTNILATATNEIKINIQSKRSNIKANRLQGFLHGIFYPSGISQISQDYLLSQTAQATEEQITQAFNNFDFENNTSGQVKNTKSINKTTVVSLINSVQKNLEIVGEKVSLLNNLTSENLLESFRIKVESLIDQANAIMASAELTKMGFITNQSFDQLIPIVNQLAGISAILSKQDFVSPQEAGLLFEKALAKVNFIKSAEDLATNELLKVLYGSEVIRRGGSNDTGFISYDISAKMIENKKTQTPTGFTLSQGAMTIKYDPFSEKQGKMDVQLYYNTPNAKNYRISAKRWSRGYGDLGETSIDAGITRAAGQSVAEAYKYAILKPRKDWAEPKNEVPDYKAYEAYEQAHKLAQIAISSDIAMGLNQGITSSGAGYANLLVVDTGTAIKVRNLADIIINADNDNLLSGYNTKDIESNALQVYRKMAKIQTGRSSTYLGLMTSVLNKMKVTIRMSV